VTREHAPAHDDHQGRFLMMGRRLATDLKLLDHIRLMAPDIVIASCCLVHTWPGILAALDQRGLRAMRTTCHVSMLDHSGRPPVRVPLWAVVHDEAEPTPSLDVVRQRSAHGEG